MKIIMVLIIIGSVIFITGYFFLSEKNAHNQIKDYVESNGIDYIEKKYSIDDQSVIVNYFEINPNLYSIGITSPQIIEKKSGKTKYGGYTLQEYMTRGAYKVIQSGGFLSSWSPPSPLGYVKIQDQEINTVHNSWITSGLFCSNGDKFIITKYQSPSQFVEWRSCIQAGPIILENGKDILQTTRNTGYVTKERHQQSFICRKNNGNFIMGIADNVKLVSFVDVLILNDKNGGLDCSDATLLNSKGVSGIYAFTSGFKGTIGNTNVPLPNAIFVREKSLDKQKLKGKLSIDKF